jgi:hypothetical protein
MLLEPLQRLNDVVCPGGRRGRHEVDDSVEPRLLLRAEVEKQNTRSIDILRGEVVKISVRQPYREGRCRRRKQHRRGDEKDRISHNYFARVVRDVSNCKGRQPTTGDSGQLAPLRFLVIGAAKSSTAAAYTLVAPHGAQISSRQPTDWRSAPVLSEFSPFH